MALSSEYAFLRHPYLYRCRKRASALTTPALSAAKAAAVTAATLSPTARLLGIVRSPSRGVSRVLRRWWRVLQGRGAVAMPREHAGARNSHLH